MDQISDDSDDGYSDDDIESDIDLEEYEEIDNLDLAEEEEEDESMPAATPARKKLWRSPRRLVGRPERPPSISLTKIPLMDLWWML